MIRFRRLSLPALNAWLTDHSPAAAGTRYRLRVWRENRAALTAIKPELLAYLDEAFADARAAIRAGFEDSLSPFVGAVIDPAANYPAVLHRVTLQGYLGETLAVLAVEHWGANGYLDWVAPAFLFRMHDQEFQHLDEINELLQTGQPYDPDHPSNQRPGRTGDDGLVFRINDQNIITDVLTLEAKCLNQNSNAKIQEAHEKLSGASARPSGVRELINLLDDYDTPEAQQWQRALLQFWREGYRTAARHDGVGYTCGTIPVQGGRTSWMPHAAPHGAYTVNRRLEGMEFQTEDLAGLVDILYRGA